MKALSYIFSLALLTLFMSACNKDENRRLDPELTGNFVEYPLFAGTEHNYRGTLRFEEKTDGGSRVRVMLEGNKSTLFFPVHLHEGPVNTAAADLLASLPPVDARELQGSGDLYELANEEPLLYKDIKQFNGHVRIHISDSPNERAIILAFGNIGSNYAVDQDASQFELPLCTVEISQN